VEEANVCDNVRSEKGVTGTDESPEERAEEMANIEVGRDYVEE
jgi:hypothetical protein